MIIAPGMEPSRPIQSGSAATPLDAAVREAITAFEQILEALPNDRLALETLYEAYEQIGDRERAHEYLIRLARVILEEADPDAAPAVVEKLRTLGTEHVQAQELLERLTQLSSPRKGDTGAAGTPAETGGRKTANIAPELTLAWTLAEAGEISQEEYSAVVHDLSEISTRNVVVPVTVQHVLQDRGFKNLEKVLQFLSSSSGMPVISLTSFEPTREAYTLLPLDFMQRRAAIVFDLMGPDALVAVLNPFDTNLQEEVRRLIGRTCHFFLTSAQAYDAYLDKIRKEVELAP